MQNVGQVLQQEPFWRPQKVAKSFSAGAPPRTPLGELTTLPRLPSRLGRGYPLPFSTQLGASITHWVPPHFWNSGYGPGLCEHPVGCYCSYCEIIGYSLCCL